MIYTNKPDEILMENTFRINNLGGDPGVRLAIHLIPGKGRSMSHGPRIKVIFKGSCSGYFEIRQSNGAVIYDKKNSDIPTNDVAEILEIIEDISYGCYRIIVAYFYNGTYYNELKEAIQRIGGARRVDRKIISKEYRERFKNIAYEK